MGRNDGEEKRAFGRFGDVDDIGRFDDVDDAGRFIDIDWNPYEQQDQDKKGTNDDDCRLMLILGPYFLVIGPNRGPADLRTLRTGLSSSEAAFSLKHKPNNPRYNSFLANLSECGTCHNALKKKIKKNHKEQRSARSIRSTE